MKRRTAMKAIVDAVFAATVLGVSESGLTPLDLSAMSAAGKAGVAVAMVVIMLLINRNIDRGYDENGKPRSKGGA